MKDEREIKEVQQIKSLSKQLSGFKEEVLREYKEQLKGEIEELYQIAKNRTFPSDGVLELKKVLSLIDPKSKQ